MAHDLIRRVEALGDPRILVVGDLILDRYLWGESGGVSREAPVPLLKVDRREQRVGGAAAVAGTLRSLGAEVRLIGGVGRDAEGVILRKLLAEQGIDDSLVVTLDDRPTTLRERYLGRSGGGPAQQMIRVDYESGEPISRDVELLIWEHIPEAVGRADLVLISDHDKGVCTPGLLRPLVTACRSLDVRVVAGPTGEGDAALDKYQGVHALAVGLHDAGAGVGGAGEAADLGRNLLQRLKLECALVMAGAEGTAVVRGDERDTVVRQRNRRSCPGVVRGDAWFAAAGISLASGSEYDEAAALGNVVRGLDVESLGAAGLTRRILLGELLGRSHDAGEKRLDRESLLAEIDRRRRLGQSVVYTAGRFEALHLGQVRLLREASSFGGFLVVGVIAGSGDDRPTGPASAEARAEVVAALGCVDAVMVVADDGRRGLIAAVAPDVLVHPGDEARDEVVGRDEVEAAGGRVVGITGVEDRAPAVPVHRDGDVIYRIHPPAPALPVPNRRPTLTTVDDKRDE